MGKISNQNKNFPRLTSQGLRVVSTAADGNCLFRSLADQLYGSPDRHLEVRQKIVNHMSNNSANFRPFINAEEGGGYRRNPGRAAAGPSSTAGPSQHELNNEWIRYINNMAKPRTWGSHVELEAFTKVYNFDVRIYQTDNDYIHHADETPDAAPRKCLHIAYHSNHYSSLRNIDSSDSGIPNTQPLDLPSYAEKVSAYDTARRSSTGSSNESRHNSPTFSDNSTKSNTSASTVGSGVKRPLESDDEEDDIWGLNSRQNREIKASRKRQKLSSSEDDLSTTGPSKTPSPPVTLAKPKAQKNLKRAYEPDEDSEDDIRGPNRRENRRIKEFRRSQRESELANEETKCQKHRVTSTKPALPKDKKPVEPANKKGVPPTLAKSQFLSVTSKKPSSTLNSTKPTGRPAKLPAPNKGIAKLNWTDPNLYRGPIKKPFAEKKFKIIGRISKKPKPKNQ